MQGRTPWETPVRYGYAEAVQSAGTVVAPLLAGFTITLIGLLVSTGANIRYPNLALLLLTGAVAFLLAAVQCAYAARQFVATPDEIASWWPGLDKVVADKPFDEPAVRKRYAEQRAHSSMRSLWTSRFRVTYHIGTLLVLLGLVVVLIPPVPPSGDVAARWAAVGIAALAFLTEATWIASTTIVVADRFNGPNRVERAVRRAALRIVPSYPDELRRAEKRVDVLANQAQPPAGGSGKQFRPR